MSFLKTYLFRMVAFLAVVAVAAAFIAPQLQDAFAAHFSPASGTPELAMRELRALDPSFGALIAGAEASSPASLTALLAAPARRLPNYLSALDEMRGVTPAADAAALRELELAQVATS